MKKLYLFILLFSVQILSAQYCIPTFTTGCTSNDDIDSVIIEDSSGNLILNHLNTGCSPGGYGDYTNNPSLYIELDADATYNITITTNYTGSQQQKVWIDFNGNESFEDPGELVFTSSTPSSNTNPTIGTITIPNMPGVHTTRLRIINRFSSLPIDSCTPGSAWGEAHDYTIIIIGENPDCYSPTDLTLDSITSTSATFSWTGSPDETDGYNWAVMADGEHPDNDTPLDTGSTATGIVTATTTQLSQNRAYSIFVQTNCGTDLSFWTGPLDILTPITPPTNDDCADAITLTLGNDFDDQAIVASNLGATVDPNDPIPTCDNFNFATNSRDVWFQVVVPASGDVNVETRSNNDPGMNNTGMEIYSGSCGNLTLIECNTDDGIDKFSLIALSGQTAGETLLVRIWGYNSHQGEFLISSYKPELPCDNPSDVTLEVIEDTFAEFSWTASTTETDGYEWAVMAEEEDPDNDTPVVTGTVGTGITTATASGLSPQTNYDFYVRTDCGADGMSYWEGPLAFSTVLIGINDLSLEGITVYPNPVEDVLNITGQESKYELSIFNIVGQKVLTQTIQSDNASIDVSHLSADIYIVQLVSETGKTMNMKLIKK